MMKRGASDSQGAALSFFGGRSLARPWQLAQGCGPPAKKPGSPPEGTPSSQARPFLSTASEPHLESTAVMKAISREMHL